jgi:tellurite resistance protein
MRQELGHVTTEGEYFHQLDVELIEKMRRRADLEERRLHMAEASQINDPNVLEALEKLGYNPATVPLLHFVPLVQVAWADGSVRHAERDRVFAIARLHGVKENTPTYEQLVAWLEQPFPEEFFRGTLRAIRAHLESLPQNERRAKQDAIMHCCTDVACAAGWHLGRIGAAERKLLDEIQKELELHQEAATSTGVQS